MNGSRHALYVDPAALNAHANPRGVPAADLCGCRCAIVAVICALERACLAGVGQISMLYGDLVPTDLLTVTFSPLLGSYIFSLLVVWQDSSLQSHLCPV